MRVFYCSKFHIGCSRSLEYAYKVVFNSAARTCWLHMISYDSYTLARIFFSSDSAFSTSNHNNLGISIVSIIFMIQVDLCLWSWWLQFLDDTINKSWVYMGLDTFLNNQVAHSITKDPTIFLLTSFCCLTCGHALSIELKLFQTRTNNAYNS